MTARSGEEQVALVESLLGPYAELQLATGNLVPGWIDVGVPDRSPQRLPELLEALVAGRPPHRPLPIDAAERAAYAQAIDGFTEVCEELAQSSTPYAIDHADIHGTNVVSAGPQPRLLDWGDACIGHPYSSLLVPIEWVARLVPASDQPAAVARLRDAYLEPWANRADGRTAALATWVGYVARAALNADQAVGSSGALVSDHQREIIALLRTWHTKRSMLHRPSDLLTPLMVW